MTIQHSVMQLHSKIDILSSGSNGFMNSNSLQNQMMQMMGGTIGRQAPPGVSGGTLQGKSKDLLEQLSHLFGDYDSVLMTAGGSDRDKEAIRKLEERLETSQDKAEKLMNEKMGMLDRQQESMAREVESSTTILTLRNEISVLKTQSNSSGILQRRVEEHAMELKKHFEEHSVEISNYEKKIAKLTQELSVATSLPTSAAMVNLDSDDVQSYTKQRVSEAVEVIVMERLIPYEFTYVISMSLSNLLLIYIYKLHWNLNTMIVCQVNSL